MRKPTMFRKALTVALMMAVGSFYSLVTNSALAQTAAKSAGELSVTGSVLINGTPAISGATVFSESKIKTSRSIWANWGAFSLGRNLK